jgi:PWWP domain
MHANYSAHSLSAFVSFHMHDVVSSGKKFASKMFSFLNASTMCLGVSPLSDLVWAKQTGFPAWPAIIWDPRFLDAKVQKQAIAVLHKSDVVWFYGANPSFGVVPLK